MTTSPAPFPENAPRRMMALSTSWRFLLAALLAIPLAGCLEAEKVPLSYLALNKTDKNIVSIVVNGEGGILDVSAQGGGGTVVCCVVLPKRWRPGLMATIKWQEGGTFKRDEKGAVVTEDGVPIVIESPWKERAVEVPKYDEKMGDFYIVFFPNDEIKVAVSNGIPKLAKLPVTQ